LFGQTKSGPFVWFSLDQTIRLLPEADFVGVAEQPTVADDAMLFDWLAREQGRLGRHCHRGNNVAHRHMPAESGQSRCVGQEPRRKPDGIDEYKRLRHASCLIKQRQSEPLAPLPNGSYLQDKDNSTLLARPKDPQRVPSGRTAHGIVRRGEKGTFYFSSSPSSNFGKNKGDAASCHERKRDATRLFFRGTHYFFSPPQSPT